VRRVIRCPTCGTLLLGPTEVAARLGVSRRTVLRWAIAGRFPNAVLEQPGRAGPRWLIPEADLEIVRKPDEG
jgi:excisionase family DNA binding protein